MKHCIQKRRITYRLLCAAIQIHTLELHSYIIIKNQEKTIPRLEKIEKKICQKQLNDENFPFTDVHDMMFLKGLLTCVKKDQKESIPFPHLAISLSRYLAISLSRYLAISVST